MNRLRLEHGLDRRVVRELDLTPSVDVLAADAAETRRGENVVEATPDSSRCFFWRSTGLLAAAAAVDDEKVRRVPLGRTVGPTARR